MIEANPVPHISEVPMTLKNWHQHINWPNVIIVVILPLCGLFATTVVPLHTTTAIWAVVYLCITSMGITAGYHRLWSHASYRASLPLQVYLAAAGASAIEGPILLWARDHRAHHRYTDTDGDPYSAHKGLFYSHIGWVIFHQDARKLGRTDISDLEADPVVMWQYNNHLFVALSVGLAIPALVAALWGDWLGGFLYAGVLRVVYIQQATHCINSLGHYFGHQPFDDRNSPHDSCITAMMTFGEGYHNFHHEFPSDYRSGIEWYQYDPTKWAIAGWKMLGLASDLKEFKANEIEKGRLQQQQKMLDKRTTQLDWGTPLHRLPSIEWLDYQHRVETEPDAVLLVIAGVLYDLSAFVGSHPGGKELLLKAVGKDATPLFNGGGGHQHSRVAHNLLATMRVATIRGGMEVETRKHPHDHHHHHHHHGHPVLSSY